MDEASRMAGIVRVVMSRLTETSRPTARRLSPPTMKSTTITSDEARKILEASFIPGRPRIAARAHSLILAANSLGVILESGFPQRYREPRRLVPTYGRAGARGDAGPRNSA